jgi:hypothetical protein
LNKTTNKTPNNLLFSGVNAIKSLFTNIAVNRLRHAIGPVQEGVIQPSTFKPFSLDSSALYIADHC